MSVSSSDKSTNRYSFANSAPGGHHSVFKMEDIISWFRNSTYPSPLPLPLDQRESIPVFCGSYQIYLGYIKKIQEKLEQNLQNGMTAHAVGNIFFEKFS